MNPLILLSPTAAASPVAPGAGAVEGRAEAGPGGTPPFAALLRGAGGRAPLPAAPALAQPPPLPEAVEADDLDSAAQPGLNLPLAGNGLPPVAAPRLPTTVPAPSLSQTAAQSDPVTAAAATALPAAPGATNSGAERPPPLAVAEIAATAARPEQVILAEQGRASPVLPSEAALASEAMLGSSPGKPVPGPPPPASLPAQAAASTPFGAAAQAPQGEADPALLAAAPGAAESGRPPTAEVELLATRPAGLLPQTGDGHAAGSQVTGLMQAATALLGAEGSASAPRAPAGLPQALYSDPGSAEFTGELFLHLRANARSGGGPQEANLQLHPAELGRLHIAITTDGDQARVVFTADNPAARDAIEASLPRLREMMDQGGLQLVRAEVGDRSQANPEQPNAGGGQAQPGDSVAAGADHEGVTTPATASGTEAPRLLDCYV